MNNTNVSAQRVAWGIGLFGLAILAASGLAALMALNCRNEDVCRVLTNLFHLTRESNIPTWYSIGLWAIAGLIALMISLVTPQAQRVLRWQWRGLAALFAFLSLDEAAMFHERIGVLFAAQLGGQDVLYYDWLIYGIAFVLAVGLLYLRFLLDLPSRTRNWIVGAAAVFLFGALGVEAFFAASHVGPLGFTDDPIQRMALYALEEVSECIGVLLLIYGLLDHLGRMNAVLNLEFNA